MSNRQYSFDQTPLFAKQYSELSKDVKERVYKIITTLVQHPENCTHGLKSNFTGWYEKWVGTGEYRIYYAMCNICRKGKAIIFEKCDDCSNIQADHVRFLKLLTKKESDEFLRKAHK